MSAPIRCVRVVDNGTVAILVSIDPANVMVELTARELSVTLSSREATQVGFDLIDAAEPVR